MGISQAEDEMIKETTEEQEDEILMTQEALGTNAEIGLTIVTIELTLETGEEMIQETEAGTTMPSLPREAASDLQSTL